MNCLLKFKAINQYFVGNTRLLDRGENSFCSNNVKKVHFDPQLLIIRATVKASMKSKEYAVEIYLTSDYYVEKADCECARGLEICHHIAAAMFASRYELSKTDVPCSWVPTASKTDTIKTWAELYDIPQPKRISQRDLYESEIAEFRDELRAELCCGFGWILKDEPEDFRSEMALDINVLLLSDAFETAKDQIEWLRGKLAETDEQIKSIADGTIGQHLSVDWLFARRFRITASNFGPLIGSMKRNRYPQSLFARLLGQRNLDGIQAIQWGKNGGRFKSTPYGKMSAMRKPLSARIMSPDPGYKSLT